MGRLPIVVIWTLADDEWPTPALLVWLPKQRGKGVRGRGSLGEGVPEEHLLLSVYRNRGGKGYAEGEVAGMGLLKVDLLLSGYRNRSGKGYTEGGGGGRGGF